MKKFFAHLMLALNLYVGMAYPTLVYAAPGDSGDTNNTIVACQTGDGDQQACVSQPDGIISGSKKAGSFVTTLNWMLMAASIVSCVVFLLKASARLSDEQYKEAIGPGVGAGIAALSMYIAFQML